MIEAGFREVTIKQLNLSISTPCVRPKALDAPILGLDS
jgi:hypothetical protein